MPHGGTRLHLQMTGHAHDHDLYASRSLTETECNYVQMEKDLLAIVFGIEKFESYLYGRKFKVETDYKPLELILKKSLLSAPKHLQRMMLHLQNFDFDSFSQSQPVCE